jgi:hypothetical protein
MAMNNPLSSVTRVRCRSFIVARGGIRGFALSLALQNTSSTEQQPVSSPMPLTLEERAAAAGDLRIPELGSPRKKDDVSSHLTIAQETCPARRTGPHAVSGCGIPAGADRARRQLAYSYCAAVPC